MLKDNLLISLKVALVQMAANLDYLLVFHHPEKTEGYVGKPKETETYWILLLTKIMMSTQKELQSYLHTRSIIFRLKIIAIFDL